ERVVDARAPPPVPRIEAEARVGTEECGEKARAELRIAALRREDEIEQLLRRGARRAVGQVLVEPLPQKLKKPLRLVGAPGAFSRVAMARSSAENCSSSIRCRSSNCSSSRRRRSWTCSKARRQRESSGIVLSGWSARARSRSSASLSGRSGSGTQQSTGQTLAHASWS